MSVWDDPDLRAGGEFVKLDNLGDTIAGTIQAIRKHRFDDGSVVPQILLVTDQGEERTLTAGQVRLKAELAQQRPEAGDHITVTLTQIEPRAGGKSLKHFAVQIRRGAGQPPAAPAPQLYPPQQYAAPAAPAQQPYGVPQVPPGYQAPAIPAAAPTAPQQIPPPAPAPQPPAAPAAQQLTPEQQAALATLTPEQRAALGRPAQ